MRFLLFGSFFLAACSGASPEAQPTAPTPSGMPGSPTVNPPQPGPPARPPSVTATGVRVPAGFAESATITVDRAGRTGPVSVHVAGLGSGLTVDDVTLPPEASKATLLVRASKAAAVVKSAADVQISVAGATAHAALAIDVVAAGSGALDTSFGKLGVVQLPAFHGEDVTVVASDHGGIALAGSSRFRNDDPA